ncbi:MAG: hypothetical protein H6945_18160 [Zoogloeaceae bacterium]|nr:hypothetical protein [Rhodocyclaceae bacterium]MCP5237662.1 hypothetical protein [Zoogloeaceae bacterium]
MLAGAAIALLNHLLDDAPWARARLARHAGNRARIVAGGVRLNLSIAADGLLAECLSEEAPQVVIEMPAPTPVAVANGVDGLMRAARIDGEVELADTLGFVFRNLRWDIEGDLANVVGDIAAHRIHRSGMATLQAGQRALGAAEANLREFVGEDTTPLVPARRLAERSHGLRQIRDALARVEKRVERLERGDN